MGELIDRDELKKHLMDMARLRTNSEIGEPTCGLTRRTVFHMSEIMKVVIDMPTIEERKTGRWIDTGEAIDDDTEVKCSECGEVLYWLANYCPNCGAEMQERREDE